jgi:hypothetical protein
MRLFPATADSFFEEVALARKDETQQCCVSTLNATWDNATWDNECNVGDILKMSFQNRFVRGHLFVKMYFLAVGDRSKSLLIYDVVFAYSSGERSF